MSKKKHNLPRALTIKNDTEQDRITQLERNLANAQNQIIQTIKAAEVSIKFMADGSNTVSSFMMELHGLHLLANSGNTPETRHTAEITMTKTIAAADRLDRFLKRQPTLALQLTSAEKMNRIGEYLADLKRYIDKWIITGTNKDQQTARQFIADNEDFFNELHNQLTQYTPPGRPRDAMLTYLGQLAAKYDERPRKMYTIAEDIYKKLDQIETDMRSEEQQALHTWIKSFMTVKDGKIDNFDDQRSKVGSTVARYRKEHIEGIKPMKLTN